MLCLLSYDCVSHSDVCVICQSQIISGFGDGLYLPEESVFSGRKAPPNYFLCPCMSVVCQKMRLSNNEFDREECGITFLNISCQLQPLPTRTYYRSV